MSINRREALRNILVASAGTIWLSSFRTTRIPGHIHNEKLMLNTRYQKYLSQISETFLPVGSYAEGIRKPEDFITEMLNHSYQPEDIEKYATGFDQFIALMKASKQKLKTKNAEGILNVVKTTLADKGIKKELAFFINTTRNLSIRNFTSSEYYVTGFYEYKLIPKKYDGCKQINITK